MHKEIVQNETKQKITRQKLTTILMVCGSLYLLVGTNNLMAKKETYYGCKNGFQFESKQQAARCIKQQRLSFQAPQQCRKNGKFFQLKIDYRGKQDMCVTEKGVNLKNEMKIKPKPGAPKAKTPRLNNKVVSFAPKCAIGFQIQIRKGKDACSKRKPEQVVAPSKKVTR